VGVNRGDRGRDGGSDRLPHARGGEPFDDDDAQREGYVFPTHVGVNRQGVSITPGMRWSSPRTWG